MSRGARYAVYWTPEPHEALWQGGCDWLGRDPREQGAPTAPPPHRAGPWRYGFHATLKPPLRLRGGAAEHDFVAAVEALAQRQKAFALPPLQVAWLSEFLALRPAVAVAMGDPLHELADCCVRQLDDWRATPTLREMAVRAASRPLDARQQVLLERWGYPHVLERWRFHLTLTDDLSAHDAGSREALAQQATRHFAVALSMPVRVRSLCVFVQAQAGAPLRLLRRLPFGA